MLKAPALAALVVLVSVLLYALDLVTDAQGRVVSIVAFLSAIVAGVGTVRQTVVTAVWSTVVEFSALAHIRLSLVDTYAPSISTALFGALSVAACRYRVRRDAEVLRLRSAAAALQRQLLRPLPTCTPEVMVHGLYLPVEEDSMVGGDVYEVAPSPWGTRVLIADVQGKGLPAMGSTFSVLGAFREAAQREADLLAVVTALDEAVARHNRYAGRSGEPERFVTALVLDFGTTATVEAVNCGHLTPLTLGPDPARGGPVPLAEPPGVPLGLLPLAPGPRRVERFDLPAEATLLVFTDGVTDSRDRQGRFYPLDERVRAWSGLPASRLAPAVAADLRAFTGGVQRDDIALLAIDRVPAGAAPQGDGPCGAPGTDTAVRQAP
ncbi:serine/threonine-protein phosphatase [Streptomyces sp. PLAI1-29]|uniref:Serine/threonine-protein phosphatase n=1 Tax=Streptomyces zingiberis TaxID=2053010 RepID=A0ABX1BRM9_9ACTN|nr:serine/threonine-protein phosphatase [Streptomyces zingiberis]